jgi:hypothetical protein
MKPGTRIEVLPNPVLCPTGMGTVVNTSDYQEMHTPSGAFNIGVILDETKCNPERCFLISPQFVEVQP